MHVAIRVAYCLQRRKYKNCETRDVFISDEASRALSGKKETVIKNKLKTQKRILTDTLLNLYLMFKGFEMSCVISYPMFCMMRPFA